MNIKELLKDSFPVIEKFAPTVAGALGGPIGVAVGFIVPALAKAFGADPTDFNDISDKIINDPNVSEKLQHVEHNHDLLCKLMSKSANLANLKLNLEATWK